VFSGMTWLMRSAPEGRHHNYVAPLSTYQPLLASILIGAGAIFIVRASIGLLGCLRAALRPSQLSSYAATDGDPTWALVTGSTDGIGKALAAELLDHGFNVVLHGRNATKLVSTKDELVLRQPTRQLETVLLDAAADGLDPKKLAQVVLQLKRLKLRILINNVGGTGGTKGLFLPFRDHSMDDINRIANVNSGFAVALTNALLPQLSANEPSLVMNIGAGSSEFAIPYHSVHCGAKAFLKAWSRSLNAEMRMLGKKVEVLHIMVGATATNTAKSLNHRTSRMAATPQAVARSILWTVGGGQSVPWAHWPHASQYYILSYLPQAVVNHFVQKEYLAQERAAKKL
jgi:17beta-estradiol 17-dehydrogenase / very-long-chain 3-oxoacyl-CoA reductase